MKIYTRIKLDIDTMETIEEESFEYEGPVALCWESSGEYGPERSGLGDRGGFGGGTNSGGVGGGRNYDTKATSAFGRFAQTLFGFRTAAPALNPKSVKPSLAVKSYMDHLNKKRGIAGRIAPTGPGVATDAGLNLASVGAGPLAPGPVIGAFSGFVNVVSNYYDDKKTAIGKLNAAGYAQKDIDASFRDYEAGLVAGLEGFGSGSGGNRELSDYEKAIAKGLKSENLGEAQEEKDTGSTTAATTATRKKTKRVFAGGQLGHIGSNQLRVKTLLGS